MTSARVEHWLTIEVLLRQVLRDHAATLNAREMAWVLEWLDHNELGLAAEILRDRVGACPDLDRALKLMGIETPERM